MLSYALLFIANLAYVLSNYVVSIDCLLGYYFIFSLHIFYVVRVRTSPYCRVVSFCEISFAVPNSDDSNLLFATGHEEADYNTTHHCVVNPALSAPFPPSLNVGNIFNVPIKLIDV